VWQYPSSAADPRHNIIIYLFGLGSLCLLGESGGPSGGKQFANLRARSDSRCVSFRRKISTPFSLRNCSSSSFLLRTSSPFQKARRKVSSPPFVLYLTAILNYEEDDGFEDSSLASFPCWEGGGRGENGV
jgi:hypothetical protein